MRGEVEETAMRARLLSHWGLAAADAPSHGPATLPGRRRMELPGRGRVELCGRRGAMTVSSSGLHGRLDKGQADEVGGLGVQVDEAT